MFLHKNVQGYVEWLLMEIAQSYDLQSSPATCTGIPLFEPCRLLLVQVGLTSGPIWEAWNNEHGLVPSFSLLFHPS